MSNSTWVLDAACADSPDPEVFSVVGLELDSANHAAVVLCGACPVRAACRDDYLDGGRLPLGIIAGGWWWDYNGRAYPYPGDRKPPRKGPAPRVSGTTHAVRKSITAARAVAAEGLTHEQAAGRHNASVRSVERASLVCRYAPELLDEVWDGGLTLTAAYGEASHRRHTAALTPV